MHGPLHADGDITTHTQAKTHGVICPECSQLTSHLGTSYILYFDFSRARTCMHACIVAHEASVSERVVPFALVADVPVAAVVQLTDVGTGMLLNILSYPGGHW